MKNISLQEVIVFPKRLNPDNYYLGIDLNCPKRLLKELVPKILLRFNTDLEGKYIFKLRTNKVFKIERVVTNEEKLVWGIPLKAYFSKEDFDYDLELRLKYALEEKGKRLHGKRARLHFKRFMREVINKVWEEKREKLEEEDVIKSEN